MPRNTTLNVKDTAIQLTDDAVVSITVINHVAEGLMILGTVAEVEPVSWEGAIPIPAGQGIINEKLSDLWPGLFATDAPGRVYAIARSTGGEVMVSHA